MSSNTTSSIWQTLLTNEPSQFESMSISQIVTICGNGILANGSIASLELRACLRNVKSENLTRYLEFCLQNSFERNGFVLQDIVNELGRRLGYEVENGLYQGRANSIGFDGLWFAPNGHALVIEVKTTDAYRINLDTVSEYRDKLITEGRVTKNSSLLLVVGRQDTGDFEAQIRGSRHAWSCRVISADALIRLVHLREKTEQASTAKIHDLMMPFEYTRLDKLIDIAFTVAEDASSSTEVTVMGNEEVVPLSVQPKQQRTPQATINDLRELIVQKLSQTHGIFIKETRALYASPDKQIRAAVTISKQYENGYFWYAYHSGWDQFLRSADKGFLVLGCVGLMEAFVIPHDYIEPLLGKMYRTEESKDKFYWHVFIRRSEAGLMGLEIKNSSSISLVPFKIDLEKYSN
jgi:hypothetical protein